MLKKAYISLLLCFAIIQASAQKLVIGSDIPSFKSLRNEISWVGDEPEESVPALIDFYQPSNPTCVSNLKRLSEIAVSQKGTLEVVILTREPDGRLENLAGKIYVGLDTTGSGFFEKCRVKYLPYTMLVDRKNKLLWHGILNSLTDDALQKRIYGGEER